MQLTNNSRSSSRPTISAETDHVVFYSNADLLGDGSNADLENEIFSINSDGTGLTQLTQSTDLSLYPSVSGDGSKITFQSTGDVLGNGSNNGFYQILAINSDGSELSRLTSDKSHSGYPSISGDVLKVVYSSLANMSDIIGNELNPNNNFEIFGIAINGSNRTQLTDISNSRHSYWPELSYDGSRVRFYSNADHLKDGSNNDGINEIFIIDVTLFLIIYSSIFQLTNEPETTQIIQAVLYCLKINRLICRFSPGCLAVSWILPGSFLSLLLP